MPLNNSPKEWPLWRDMTSKAYRVSFISCFGAIVYGYDVSWWSSVLGMPEFTRQFGIYNPIRKTHAIAPSLQSAGSALPYAAQFCGSYLSPLLSDRWGRRAAMAVMACLYLIAVIIEVTSESFWQIVAGRMFNAIPQGMAASLIPVYQSECAPKSCRGSLISIYTWFIDVGAVLATGIVYNTYSRPDSGAYKIVMGLQGIFPVLILLGVWFIPESPRYLCMKGKDEQALEVLISLRIDRVTAEQELAEINAGLETHVNDISWKDLFKGSNLRRTVIAIAIPVIEAWQGLSFIGNYLVIFFQSLGTTNTYQLIVLINSVLLITLTLFFWSPDYYGRRFLFLLGSGVMGTAMFITAGVSSRNPMNISTTRQQIAVAMLFIWSIFYSSTWANLTWITLAEIPTTRLKTKTAGLGYSCQVVSSIIITLVSPYMQSASYANWGPYIGFFFGSFSFIGLIFVFFFFPETKGASIEELDMFFEQKLSVSAFGKASRGNIIRSLDVELELAVEELKVFQTKSENRASS